MIKEKFLSHVFFKPKGTNPTPKADEYGIAKIGFDDNSNIYHREYNASILIEQLDQASRNLKIHKPSSFFEFKFSFQLNRGYSLERYFFKQIRRSDFYTFNKSRAKAILLPATPYMYHVAGSFLAKLYRAIFFEKKSRVNYKRRRKRIIEFFLQGAFKKWRFNNIKTKEVKTPILITSHIPGSGLLNDTASDIQKDAILLANSSDNKFGPFNFKKDVALVCNLDYKMPKYAYDVRAFSKLYGDRTHYSSFIGDIFDMRAQIYSKRTTQCKWVDHHIPFKDYVDIYANSKYYFHLPGHAEWSPRLFEGMFLGAIPVILYQKYILPFSDILDWSSFAILVPESEWENVFDILSQIDEKRYNYLQNNLKSAIKHFCYHKKPIPGDAFYMTMLSIYIRQKNLSGISSNTETQR